MERVAQSLGERLPPVTLYYEDVLALVDAMSMSGVTPELRTDRHRLEGPKELPQIEAPYLTHLTITIRDPYVSVDMKPDGIWLYASDDTPVQRGIYEKVKALLRDRRRHYANILHASLIWGLVLGSSLLFLPIAVERRSVYWLIPTLCLLAVGLLWARAGFKSRFREYTKVFPIARRENPSFWQRKRDELILAGISAILGAAAALLLERLLYCFGTQTSSSQFTLTTHCSGRGDSGGLQLGGPVRGWGWYRPRR